MQRSEQADRESSQPPAREEAQAAVALVAVVPLLIASCAVLVQVSVIGYSAWSAAGAARAGARAVLVRGSARPAAMAALPRALRDRADVSVERDVGTVRVELVPLRLFPGAPTPAVGASAAFAPDGGGNAAG